MIGRRPESIIHTAPNLLPISHIFVPPLYSPTLVPAASATCRRGTRYLNSNTLNQRITANIIYDVQDSSPFCLFHSHCLVSVLLAFEFQHRFSLSFFLFSINSSCSIPFSLFSFFCSQTLIRNKYYVAHDRNKPPFTFFSFCMALAPSFLDYLSLTTTKSISSIILWHYPHCFPLSFFSTIASFIRPLLLSDYAYSSSAISKIANLELSRGSVHTKG